MPERHRFPLYAWRVLRPVALCALLAACAAAPRFDAASATRTSPQPDAPTATAPTAAASDGAPATLLLISLDGLRPQDLDAFRPPTLERLRREGVQAQWMNPSYPSLTFPNHYTLVTGLRPDKHGIVNNTMRDAVLGRFGLRLREAVGDARWWGGEPLWTTLEKAGVRTATMFWPGSEAPIGGVRPWQWREFSYDVSVQTRVDTVLGWMALPPAQRPRFVTLYFEHTDRAGHEHGPGSPQVRDALLAVDAALARLLDGLAQRGLVDAVNIVIVSDHGMARASLSRSIAVESLAPADVAEAITFGQVLGFTPRPGREADAAAALLRRHPHTRCWRKSELPAHWHFGTHPRVPAFVCQMDEGWSALTAERMQAWRAAGGRDKGEHGYAPEAASMRAIFIAHGPAFRSGVQLPPFDNVSVYPLLARLVGVAPLPNDGDPDALRAALKP
jgi:predicted AlkP superfamily pyrophosphatase or phosphodiesterase